MRDHIPALSARARIGAARAATALVVACVAAAVLSSCGTAPPAAIVNGQEISFQQLDQQLAGWASNPAYVRYQDALFLQQAEQSYEEGNTNVELYSVQAAAGTGPGNYGMVWSALELSLMVTDVAVQQHLQHLGEAPSPLQLVASWQSEYADHPDIWEALSPAARSSAAQADADHALVERSVSSASQDAKFYKGNEADFWSQVCLATADVSVPGASGAVNMAASKRQAEQVASELSGHGAPGSQAVTGGALYCDSPEELIEQPPSFQQQVRQLAPGQASIVAESYGYQVVEVRSRSVIPYDKAVVGDIDVVASRGGSQSLPNGDGDVVGILLSAHVKVNPTFGSWSTNEPAPCAPQVQALATSGCLG